MKMLFIDTSLKDVSIATYESSKLLSVISECIPNMHSIYTIPYIDRCLTESKIDKKEVEKIIVINGPGSFTGIRIGLTIAKVYSYILNINVVCVSSLKALALSTSGEIIISVLNARNDNYYVGIYDKYYNNIDKECFMNKEELISLISKYEKGHTLISTTFLMEYVKLYHISSDYLLGKIDTKIIIEDSNIQFFNNKI